MTDEVDPTVTFDMIEHGLAVLLDHLTPKPDPEPGDQT